MPPNDDIVFTSRATLRVPHLPPSNSHSSFRFCFRNMASQFDQSCHSIFQFIDSVKRGSKLTNFNHSIPHFWPPSLPFWGSKKITQRGNSVSRWASGSCGAMFVDKSSLICSASLSLIQSDGSNKAESGTRAEHSGRQRGMDDKSTGLVGKSSLLCSASLALARSDEASQPSGSESKESPQKGYSAGRPDEERVLISEVLVRNKDGEELERKDLEMEVLTALKASRPNSALTVREVQEDVHRIINSGYFYSCIPVAVDTRDGIRLIFQVEPNQEFQGLVCEGANVLPAKFLEEAFRDGYGKVVNLRHLDEVISSINSWYGERGLFGRVSAVDILSGGILSLQVSEAEVNNISIRFLDKKTGEPISGNTRPDTILRQLTTKKGQVYSMLQGKRDAETVLTMGIMEDVSIIPQPAADAGKVDLLMNVVERPSGGFSAGGGLSCGTTGGAGPLAALIGSFAYSHRNLFGRNQKLHVSLERGQVDFTFRINYTDPWIEGDDKRTSRTIMVQNSRTPGTLVHGGSNLTIGRVTAGLEFNRPIRPKWSGTGGLYFQRAGARDEQGNPIIMDTIKCPLTASGNADDNMLLAKLESVYTGSGDHGSSMFVLSMEQGLPFLPEWLCFNRVNARARTGVEVGPSQFLLSLSGGHVVGKFCPHEAFAIGGTNSVRGYEEGAVGSGRSYAVGCGEISFPLFAPVEGVLFADYGTDLGSGSTVPGDPAGARMKPGSGYGYGFGIRLDSPLGPLRLEYAFNDKGAKRFHFGVGHRN
ncbi:outer envelope protein 80, chloroplastic [Cucurbita pepo subsp. pepo]|uniref:outer envelope protein 80, chloroplastic n=1 Tax=Cucurbita pepo subsp. pepo TaxID=3664 RepID=UPI000C9D5FE5|nr:outer envelope protein 80, chloroplastic [Cucurbita pepo subsp. pepo]